MSALSDLLLLQEHCLLGYWKVSLCNSGFLDTFVFASYLYLCKESLFPHTLSRFFGLLLLRILKFMWFYKVNCIKLEVLLLFLCFCFSLISLSFLILYLFHFFFFLWFPQLEGEAGLCLSQGILVYSEYKLSLFVSSA